MAYTSWEVKARYNEKAYSRINVLMPIDTKDRFKAKCDSLGVSMASVAKDIMEGYIIESNIRTDKELGEG